MISQYLPPNQADLLDQLRSMGFTNEILVLKALQETNYRLDRTITSLLIARESDILRIQEATNSTHSEASAAFEYTNGEILKAIHYLRQQMRAKIQFASAEELGQAVFVTALQKRKSKAQRQTALKKRQLQQTLLQQEETQTVKKTTASAEQEEFPTKEVVATNDSKPGESIDEEIIEIVEPKNLRKVRL